MGCCAPGWGAEVVLVGDARAVARDWVLSAAADQPALSAAADQAAFRGAFVSGSAAYLPASAELPATSDVDIVVVTAGRQPPPKLGKLVHDGVLLDVSYAPWSAITSARQVAKSYVLAPALAAEDTLLADPTGRLATLHRVIAAGFATPAAVADRVDHVLAGVERHLDDVDPSAPWAEQVLAVFPLSLPTQVPLVAALRPPTVRLRYLRAREVTSAPMYESLLRLLGCAEVSAEVVTAALDRLTEVFDTTVPVARSPYAFAGDLTVAGRPGAIDGSRALVDAGEHREAVFWIVATLARCQLMLLTDAPSLTDPESFADTVGELTGLRTPADIRNRRTETLALLPRLRAEALHLS